MCGCQTTYLARRTKSICKHKSLTPAYNKAYHKGLARVFVGKFCGCLEFLSLWDSFVVGVALLVCPAVSTNNFGRSQKKSTFDNIK